MTVHTLSPGKPLPFKGTAKGLTLALGIVHGHEVPEQVHVHVHGEGGRNVTLDLSYCLHPVREMRHLTAALELDMTEHPAETPDGCAAVEFRASRYEDGILLTLRATVPVPAVWPVSG